MSFLMEEISVTEYVYIQNLHAHARLSPQTKLLSVKVYPTTEIKLFR